MIFEGMKKKASPKPTHLEQRAIDKMFRKKKEIEIEPIILP